MLLDPGSAVRFGRDDILSLAKESMMTAKRWVNKPEGSNWGRFGADDQRGKMNLLTPERRVDAAREVKEGIAFTLSLPLDYPGGNAIFAHRKAPVLQYEKRGGAAYNFNFKLSHICA